MAETTTTASNNSFVDGSSASTRSPYVLSSLNESTSMMVGDNCNTDNVDETNTKKRKTTATSEANHGTGTGQEEKERAVIKSARLEDDDDHYDSGGVTTTMSMPTTTTTTDSDFLAEHKQKIEEKRAYCRMISQRARQRTKDEILQLTAKAEMQTARVQELEAQVKKLQNQVATVTADNTRLSQLCSRFVSSALSGRAQAPGAVAVAPGPAGPPVGSSYILPHLLSGASAAAGYGAGFGGTAPPVPAFPPLTDPYSAAAYGYNPSPYPGFGGCFPPPPPPPPFVMMPPSTVPCLHHHHVPNISSPSQAAAMALGAEAERARLRAAGINVDTAAGAIATTAATATRRLSNAAGGGGSSSPSQAQQQQLQDLVESLLAGRSV